MLTDFSIAGESGLLASIRRGVCSRRMALFTHVEIGEFAEKSHLMASIATSGELSVGSAPSTTIVLQSLMEFGVKPPKTTLLRQEPFGVVVGDKLPL